MKEKLNIKRLVRWWHKMPRRTQIIIVAVTIIAGYGLIFFLPKPITYGYSANECVRQLTLFPDLVKQGDSSKYKIELKNVLKIGSLSLASTRVCFQATSAPEPGKTSVSLSPFGGPLFIKRFDLTTKELPVAHTTDFIGKTLPVTRPVVIGLDKADDVFDYRLKVGDKIALCAHHDQRLECDIEALDLPQGETFTASLTRYFQGKKLTVLGEGKLTTLRALVLQKASVSPGQTIYDAPVAFTFQYDKDLQIAEAVLEQKEGEAWQAMTASVTKDDKTVKVTPKGALAREKSYRLTIGKAEAADGSALPEPYVVEFFAAGGPKVTGVSVGTTGVPAGGTIFVTFDQEVADWEGAKKLVGVQGMSAYGLSGAGNRLAITYSTGQCIDFKLTVTKGMKNAAGITQANDWAFSGRSVCYGVQSIGASRQGRSITAYVFGSGSRTILFTGAIHGNEHSARLLMNAWIGELDAGARSIPSGTRVIVIPNVNPDGTAANSRYNAAGVDLNRNYNTSDWKKDVETVNGQPLPGGGGPNPGSEPETQALMAYTQALRPVLTMSFHSSASYTIGNTCGNSAALANTYAKMTGYRNMTGVSGAFSYQITGTYDDWICERLGLASVLIELATSTNSEFSRNRAALWAMVKS